MFSGTNYSFPILTLDSENVQCMSCQNNDEGNDSSDNVGSFCDGSFNEDNSCVDEIDNISNLQFELRNLKRELRKANVVVAW